MESDLFWDRSLSCLLGWVASPILSLTSYADWPRRCPLSWIKAEEGIRTQTPSFIVAVCAWDNTADGLPA